MQKIASIEPMVVLGRQSRGPFPNVIDWKELTEVLSEHPLLYFARARDVELVKTREVKEQGYWTVAETYSPVVECMPSPFDGSTMRPGRLYYNDKYFNQAGKLEDKTPSFAAWSKKLFSMAKRLCRYDRERLAYMGADAANLAAKGMTLLDF